MLLNLIIYSFLLKLKKMILQNKTSGSILDYKPLIVNDKSEVEKVKETQINPVQDVDLDKLLNDLNKLEVKEQQQGNVVIESNDKKKNLSQLKHVSGVLEYYKMKKLDKEKNSIPKYLFDLTTDILYYKKCQILISNSNICHIRLPLIVINSEYYDLFIKFLNTYYQYSKYDENTALIEYLILSDKSFKKYSQFHDSQKNVGFAAECISTSLIEIYDTNQLSKIENKLEEYFNKKNIKGYSVDLYYDEWMDTVIEILFNYILFYFDQTPTITICEKCKKKVMFVQFPMPIFDYKVNPYYYEQVYQDIKDNEAYPKSIDIANNIMDNLELSDDYVSISRNKKETNKTRDNSSVNIIYYDENMFKNYKEVVSDSYLFEKESNGTCLLISNIKSFLIILKEFKKCKEYPKFHLICTGSTFENLAKYLSKFNDIGKIIVSVVLYTMNPNKYTYLKQKFKIIKEICFEQGQIINYIRKNKSNNNIKYKIHNLITYDDYNNKYIEFHKSISLQYGKLYQKSSYLTAINILEEYLQSEKKDKREDVDLDSIISNLQVFSRGARDYKEIIREYTNESFYKLFNKWLNETDPLAIKKIAYFISGLQLSLNIYGMKEKKGFNYKCELYRGVLLEYSYILKYLKNIGNIITIPSFFSTSLDLDIAKEFAHYNEPKQNRNNLFSVIYIVTVEPKNNWIAQGFSINELSHYEKEKEILFQPFCFFKIANIVVNTDKNICNIYLNLIGKKEIWEQSMNNTSSVFYLENENVVELNKFKSP